MTITSTAFENFGEIPLIYTCDGEGISPPLNISDIPKETKSLVLIIDDPDAVGGVFDHLLLWNIDPNIAEIPEDTLPKEAEVGVNSAGKLGFTPPCPPSGIHHYRFILSALNEKLNLPKGANRDRLVDAIKTVKVLQRAELVGIYTSKEDEIGAKL